MEESNTTDQKSGELPITIDPIKVNITTEKTKTSSSAPPPLINFQLTNPIVYIKAWWKKLIGNEGIKLTLQIKPVTAVILALIFCGAGFGVGRITIPDPLLPYLPIASPTPTPSPNPWRETAFTGKLQFANNKYFLLTTSAEAITLEAPTTINLAKLVGKRILIVGQYNKVTKTMVVVDTTDLEILPTTPVPLPTITPSPIPSPTPI
jgi:hypothetical protein